MFGGEGVGAIFAVVLGHDLDDGKDEGDERVLEDLGPGALMAVSSELGRLFA